MLDSRSAGELQHWKTMGVGPMWAIIPVSARPRKGREKSEAEKMQTDTVL